MAQKNRPPRVIPPPLPALQPGEERAICAHCGAAYFRQKLTPGGHASRGKNCPPCTTKLKSSGARNVLARAGHRGRERQMALPIGDGRLKLLPAPTGPWSEPTACGRTWRDMPGGDDVDRKMNFFFWRRMAPRYRAKWMHIMARATHSEKLLLFGKAAAEDR